MADLGPHGPGSCSSSLVPCMGDEDSGPEEDQEQLTEAPKLMETKGPVIAGTSPEKEWESMQHQTTISQLPRGT